MEVIFDRGTLLFSSNGLSSNGTSSYGRSPASSPSVGAEENRLSASELPPYWRWDARVGQWRALACSLPRFRRWLAERRIELTYRSPRPQWFVPLPVPRERWPALRPYQREALEAWTAAGRRGLVALPTGSGKTRLAVTAALSLGLPTAVLVPTRQLLQQWRSAVAESYPGPVGALGDGEHEPQPITVTTYESAHRHFDRYGDHFDLVVLDEAHHVASAEVREALQMSTAPARLGLSATFSETALEAPDLDEVLGRTCYSLPVARLTGKYLSTFEVKVLPLHLSPQEEKEYDANRTAFLSCVRPFFEAHPESDWADFVRAASRSPAGRGALEALRRSREVLSLAQAKLLAIDCLLDLHRAEPKLVFTADNKAAYEVSERFLVPAITCDIGRGERDLILRRFRDGVYRTIVSAKVLNEGLDVPAASVAVIAGGSGSPVEQAQRIGRVLRPQEGKKAIIYELVIAGTSEWRTSQRRSRTDALEAASPL